MLKNSSLEDPDFHKSATGVPKQAVQHPSPNCAECACELHFPRRIMLVQVGEGTLAHVAKVQVPQVPLLLNGKFTDWEKCRSHGACRGARELRSPVK